MAKRLVTSNRESDGKFALRLESNAAVLRDQMREEARRKRAEEIRNDPRYASYIADGIDPAELFA